MKKVSSTTGLKTSMLRNNGLLKPLPGNSIVPTAPSATGQRKAAGNSNAAACSNPAKTSTTQHATSPCCWQIKSRDNSKTVLRRQHTSSTPLPVWPPHYYRPGSMKKESKRTWPARKTTPPTKKRLWPNLKKYSV